MKVKKQEISDSELALKKLEHDIGLVAKEKANAEGLKEGLEKQFTWIGDEHQYVGFSACGVGRKRLIMGCRFFGKAGSPYDFSGVNLAQAREQCRELETQQKGMGRKINTKVMNMIEGYVVSLNLYSVFVDTPHTLSCISRYLTCSVPDLLNFTQSSSLPEPSLNSVNSKLRTDTRSVEKKEQALKKMMATVLKDKSMIEDTIVELDRYKRDALTKTWEKVNE